MHPQTQTCRACWCQGELSELRTGPDQSLTSSGCIVSLYPLLSWQHKTHRAPQIYQHKARGIKWRTTTPTSAKDLHPTNPPTKSISLIPKLQNFSNPPTCLAPHRIQFLSFSFKTKYSNAIDKLMAPFHSQHAHNRTSLLRLWEERGWRKLLSHIKWLPTTGFFVFYILPRFQLHNIPNAQCINLCFTALLPVNIILYAVIFGQHHSKTSLPSTRVNGKHRIFSQTLQKKTTRKVVGWLVMLAEGHQEEWVWITVWVREEVNEWMKESKLLSGSIKCFTSEKTSMFLIHSPLIRFIMCFHSVSSVTSFSFFQS